LYRNIIPFLNNNISHKGWKLSFFVLLVFMGTSCTSTRWTVKQKNAVDPDDNTLISSTNFLQQAGSITPENPVLKLDLYHINTYEYAEKVLAERFIQQYRPRWGFMAFGLLGAGLSLYAANTTKLIAGQSQTQSTALNATGGILTLSSILNMKPVGEPQKTGEERFLRKTGEKMVIDTVRAEPDKDSKLNITIRYKDRLLMSESPRSFQDSSLSINLARELKPDQIDTQNPDSLHVQVAFGEQDYSYSVPVTSLLIRYVKVTTPVTELRNAPEKVESNILTDLARDSQLRLVERVDDEWYKVMYGLSQTYISQNDAEVIWRTDEFNQEETIVTIPNVPFGNIDVENNIPILADLKRRGAGLIIANENYQNPYDVRKYGLRDARLMHTYWTDAFGIASRNIFQMKDVESKNNIDYTLGRLSAYLKQDTTRLFVYLSGYGVIRKENNEYQYYLVPVDSSAKQNPSQWIDLKKILSRIGSMKTQYTVVAADIDFIQKGSNVDLSGEDARNALLLNTLSRLLTAQNPESVMMFPSHLGQQSLIYRQGTSTDKKHHIFPYYLARALQLRKTDLQSIENYLERNVTFMARRLHDQPQDPQIFGNTHIQLITLDQE